LFKVIIIPFQDSYCPIPRLLTGVNYFKVGQILQIAIGLVPRRSQLQNLALFSEFVQGYYYPIPRFLLSHSKILIIPFQDSYYPIPRFLLSHSKILIVPFQGS
jgi:hypothetical protein